MEYPKVHQKISPIINELLTVLQEELEAPIDIKVRRNGQVLFFDNNVEVTGSAVSDGLYRFIYYTIALHTAIDFAKRYGMENRTMVLLEEPESHMFPYLVKPLSETIERASQTVKVVIVTHNPYLVSTLWDRISRLKTYYVYRDKTTASTFAVEIDIEKLAEALGTSDDLLTHSPSRVISEFAKEI